MRFLTHDVPAAGGVFKASPEDFEVEELPAYLPNGLPDGEHAFVWIEKRGLSTPDAAKLIARHVGLRDQDVSWAGLKDKHAVTRQWLSLPFKAAAALAGFKAPGLEVKQLSRHRNKLKAGHLKGNRFSLVVRDVRDVDAARASFERLVAQGLPNFFGDQRFGARGDNAERGKQILLSGGRHRDRFERKLFLSAFQSKLFNDVLEQRLERGLFATVLAGDVLKKHETNGEFVCEAPDVDQPRANAFEVSAAGPLFGPEMRAATGVPGQLEADVLTSAGVTIDTFKTGGDETRGTRRFFRVRLGDPTFEPGTGTFKVTFSLPAGTYATVVLDELIKPAA